MIDSAAVDHTLGEILDQIDDPLRRAAARRRARDLYDNPLVPVTLRATAAAYVADAYLAEDRMDDVCRWYRLANELDPSSSAYGRSLDLLGCTP